LTAPAGEAPAAAPSQSAASAPAAESLPSLVRSALKPLLPVEPGQSVQMKLTTVSLGEITLTLKEENGGLVVRLESGSSQAQEALKAAAPLLAAVFKEEGQPLARLEFGGQPGSGRGTDGQGGSGARGGQDGAGEGAKTRQDRPQGNSDYELFVDKEDAS
jgi:flagellar hook-length control protein FliK